MTVISDIGGTSHNSFVMNNKVTVFQGLGIPSTNLGKNGDIYIQEEGDMWIKKNGIWLNLSNSTLPDATTGTNKLVYSDGSIYRFADAEIDSNGKIVVDDIAITKPSASSSTTGTDIPTTGWVNDPSTATNVVHRTGAETIGGTKTFTSDIVGTAYRAYWGDLAEFYEADNDYPEGTLVEFGGDKEITIAMNDCNAVVSSNPGFILNTENGFEHPCKIALAGRVPVRVIGKVKKFDYLQLSETPGVAEIIPDEDFNFSNVIARALENKDSDEEGLVLCVTKFEL